MVNAAITDRDLCAARALLRWTQGDLAEEASVPIVYIRRFERGTPMKEQHLKDVLVTLNKAGVVFFGEESIDGGRVAGGVALKRSAKPKAPFEKRVYPPRLIHGARTAAAKAAENRANRKAKATRKTRVRDGK